jgi:hypothetical protein
LKQWKKELKNLMKIFESENETGKNLSNLIVNI